jgi:hypothetical protein
MDIERVSPEARLADAGDPAPTPGTAAEPAVCSVSGPAHKIENPHRPTADSAGRPNSCVQDAQQWRRTWIIQP